MILTLLGVYRIIPVGDVDLELQIVVFRFLATVVLILHGYYTSTYITGCARCKILGTDYIFGVLGYYTSTYITGCACCKILGTDYIFWVPYTF